MPTLRLTVLSLCLISCTQTLAMKHFPAPPPKIWAIELQRLKYIKNWTIDGKISIDRNDETTFGGFKWLQKKHSYRIKIYPPFGTDFIQIIGRGHRATLVHNKQRLTRANPERLMQEQIGWHLPVSGLYYWIRGLPVPGKHTKARFKIGGQLSSLEQGKWRIYYLRYTYEKGYYLPEKIMLIRPELRIKILIKRWKV